MKILILFLITIVLTNNCFSQFTCKGFEGKTITNNNLPNMSYYAYSSSLQKMYKDEEYYYNWETHYLLYQKLRFNEDGSLIDLDELYIHYEDIDDAFIEEQIAKGKSVYSTMKFGYGAYYLVNETKSTTKYTVEVRTKPKTVTYLSYNKEGYNASGSDMKTGTYLDFASENEAEDFFKKLKEKKWDASIDLSDATKRVGMPGYEAIAATEEAERQEILASKQIPRKSLEEQLANYDGTDAYRFAYFYNTFDERRTSKAIIKYDRSTGEVLQRATPSYDFEIAGYMIKNEGLPGYTFFGPDKRTGKYFCWNNGRAALWYGSRSDEYSNALLESRTGYVNLNSYFKITNKKDKGELRVDRTDGTVKNENDSFVYQFEGSMSGIELMLILALLKNL